MRRRRARPDPAEVWLPREPAVVPRLVASAVSAGAAVEGAAVALAIAVYQMTRSTGWVSAVLLASLGLSAVLSPFGGVVADRYPRRTVMVVSALVQGTTLERVARGLGLTGKPAPAPERATETGPLSQLDLVEFAVTGDHAISGSFVRELGLPRDMLIAVIQRNGRSIPPRGSTIVRAGDRLYVLAPPERRPDLEDVLGRWRRTI